jgi:hypothetical protein
MGVADRLKRSKRFVPHLQDRGDSCPSGECDPGQGGTRTEDGILVLADISGSTAFVTATDLEHGPPIIAALLEEVIRHISPPLEIQEVEGDAVFALSPRGRLVPPATLLDVLEAGFAGFERRLREIQEAETCICPCNACWNVLSLSLKIVGHYGSFLRQMVGGRMQAAGMDVILTHCLLKNGLPKTRGYLLLTAPALSFIGVDPARIGLAPHTENYEHFGDIDCFVGDLGNLRSQSLRLPGRGRPLAPSNP